MRNAYYNGPGGVFYDDRHDTIFVIVKPNRLYNRYDIYYSSKPLVTNIFILNFAVEHVIRLDDVPKGFPK